MKKENKTKQNKTKWKYLSGQPGEIKLATEPGETQLSKPGASE